MTTTKNGTSLIEVLLLTSKSTGSGLVFPKVQNPALPALHCTVQAPAQELCSQHTACVLRVAGSLTKPSRLRRREKRSKRRVCAVSSRCVGGFSASAPALLQAQLLRLSCPPQTPVLGRFSFGSKGSPCLAYLFAMRVVEELESWPENYRRRRWVRRSAAASSGMLSLINSILSCSIASETCMVLFWQCPPDQSCKPSSRCACLTCCACFGRCPSQRPAPCVDTTG